MRIAEERIDHWNAMAVKALVLQAAAEGDAELDFSEVGIVDSSAVSILMAWLRVHGKAGRKALVRGVPEKMKSLMKLYGIYGLAAPYLEEGS